MPKDARTMLFGGQGFIVPLNKYFSQLKDRQNAARSSVPARRTSVPSGGQVLFFSSGPFCLLALSQALNLVLGAGAWRTSLI